MKVLKFGGSSVASSESIHKVISIVKNNSYSKHNIAVIVSALGGVTDLLVDAANLACNSDASA